MSNDGTGVNAELKTQPTPVGPPTEPPVAAPLVEGNTPPIEPANSRRLTRPDSLRKSSPKPPPGTEGLSGLRSPKVPVFSDDDNVGAPFGILDGPKDLHHDVESHLDE